jgi:hypothetical protein
MHDKRRTLATRAYIVDAAKRYQTPIAAAFRKALNIGAPKPKPARRRHDKQPRGKKRGYQPSKRELEECRKQKHGVTYREQ